MVLIQSQFSNTLHLMLSRGEARATWEIPSKIRDISGASIGTYLRQRNFYTLRSLPQNPQIVYVKQFYENIMGKRVRLEDDDDDEQRLVKRARPSSLDRLSKLSDELILRVLSYLPVSQLVVCQR